MNTDQTALREDLIAKIVVESLTQVPCDEDSHLPSWAYFAARTILTEFPYLGQQPQTTLHVPASDLPPRFTPSDTHIRAGLVGIGQQPRLDPELRNKIGDLLWQTHARMSAHAFECLFSQIMALIDSIAPAAQPQIDREALAKLIQKGLQRDMNLGSISALDCADYVIAHLNAAPAAQPLPTRSQLREVQTRKYLYYGATHPMGWESQPRPYHDIDALIAAGYAREDEPEPQVDAADHVAVSRDEIIEALEEYATDKFWAGSKGEPYASRSSESRARLIALIDAAIADQTDAEDE